MTAHNKNLTADLDAIFANLSKEDRVRQYQKIKAAQAYLDLKMKALKKKVLEQQDDRFEIVVGQVRHSAPNKAQYIELHGQAAWDKDSKSTKLAPFVRGLK
mgnify:CR=1 FL=1